MGPIVNFSKRTDNAPWARRETARKGLMMSCCNLCFQVNLSLRDPRLAQGHTVCGVPTEEEIVAYLCGERPDLVGNTWIAQKAVRAFVEDDGRQVWMVNGDEYYAVDREKGEAERLNIIDY